MLYNNYKIKYSKNINIYKNFKIYYCTNYIFYYIIILFKLFIKFIILLFFI